MSRIQRVHHDTSHWPVSHPFSSCASPRQHKRFTIAAHTTATYPPPSPSCSSPVSKAQHTACQSRVFSIWTHTFAADVSADAVLVLAPIPFLRDVHLSQNRRILILTTFSSSLFVSAISITQSAFLFRAYGLITVVLAEFKVNPSRLSPLHVTHMMDACACVRSPRRSLSATSSSS